ncbi:MAG TPA: HD domain-containing phosphohydrolase [Thermoanaerobaculia bacterium]|nr:HD domain-containing phosphohydrolase [Thermoanaerobaculia bacterium]
MSILTPDSRAASVTPLPAALARRAAEWLGRDRRGVRFATGLAAGLLGEALARVGPPPSLAAALSPSISFLSGLLLGVPGILGAAAGQILAGWGLHGAFLPALVAAVALSAQGMAALLIFRSVPRLGRGIPGLRSYLWLCGAAVLGGLVSALALGLLGPGLTAPEVWTGGAASLLAVLILAPPVLILVDRFARRWILPLPGEVVDHGLVPIGRSPSAAPITGEETLILAPPKPRWKPEPGLFLGAAAVVVVTLIAVPLAGLLPAGGGWTLLLYLVPILWAALRFGLHGGLLAASASGFCFLTGLSWMVTGFGVPGPGMALVSDYAELLILALAGAFVGASSEEQVRLRDALLDSNRYLRRDLLRVARALTGAVEAKDAYTEGHLRRVSEYAVSVGERLGLKGQELERLHYAAMLHDVGKLGVPEEVLRKAGPLDADEMEIMRRHPEIGARLLEKLDVLQDTAPLVLAHQERYDGRRHGDRPGYPQGLSGEDIPLGSRIIAVVDTFDAMTTTRPYREALPVENAVEVLRRERGRQFDPRVVDAFLEILSERPWRLL